MADSTGQRRCRLSWLTWLTLTLVLGTLMLRQLLGVPFGRWGYIAYGWPRAMVVRQVDLSAGALPGASPTNWPFFFRFRISRWSTSDMYIVKVIRAGIAVDVTIALCALVGAGVTIERWWRKYRPRLNLKSMLVLTGFAGTACAFGNYSELDWEKAAAQFCEAVIFVSLCAAWFVVIEFASLCFDWCTSSKPSRVAADQPHPLD